MVAFVFSAFLDHCSNFMFVCFYVCQLECLACEVLRVLIT